MRSASTRTAGLAAAALVSATLIAVIPGAPVTQAAASAAVSSSIGNGGIPVVTGSVTVTLTDGTTTRFDAAELTSRLPFDTGFQVSQVASVANNTNVSILLSTSTASLVAPGTSVELNGKTGGDLLITLASYGW